MSEDRFRRWVQEGGPLTCEEDGSVTGGFLVPEETTHDQCGALRHFLANLGLCQHDTETINWPEEIRKASLRRHAAGGRKP